jgi:hypothetical protein
MRYPNSFFDFSPPLGVPQRSADWTARCRCPSEPPPPLSSLLDDQSSLRRDEPGGGGTLGGWKTGLATQSSLRPGEHGGGETNWRVLGAVLVTLALSGRALAQGVPEQQIAQIRQLEQQYALAFRTLYRTELHFMRIVCQPTKKQFEKLAADGEPELKAMVKKFSSTLRTGGANQQSDPRTLIANVVAKSVQPVLSPEQAARYQKELDQRASARKRVWLLNLVRMVDRVLVLTAEQRDKLGKILEKNWNGSWNQTQILTYGGQYFPKMPDSEILPILTENQKTVWQGIPKGTVNFGFNPNMLEAIDIGDEVWNEKRPEEEPARVAGKAAAKEKGPNKPVEKK